MNWIDIEHKYYMQVFSRLPLVISKGKGVYVWDNQGNKYLDFVAGIAVNSLGHCHPVMVKAISEQAKQLVHVSNLYYTQPQLRLAQLLVENSAMQKVFFCNSGTEATEAAVKLARRYGHLHINGAYEVITANGSFHGRTLAMVAACGQEKFHKPYIPVPAGFVNVDYDNVEAIINATTDKTCAVMLEPIQGEGGVNVPQDGYFKQVRQWCDEKGILLILDEVQTGVGRTGSLFAYEQLGIIPDIMALAKGLADGFPIGAMLSTEKASVFALGEHGSTFGGNPLACTAGYAVLKFIIENKLSQHAAEMGKKLRDGLLMLKNDFNLINEVRGRGLLMAVEFSSNIARQVVLACMANGLLVNEVKPDTVRLMPPLIVDGQDVDKALYITRKSLIQVSGGANK